MNRVAKVLGVDIAADQVETILRTLGLQPEKTADGFQTTSPGFRFDIEIEADLIEESAACTATKTSPTKPHQAA